MIWLGQLETPISLAREALADARELLDQVGVVVVRRLVAGEVDALLAHDAVEDRERAPGELGLFGRVAVVIARDVSVEHVAVVVVRDPPGLVLRVRGVRRDDIRDGEPAFEERGGDALCEADAVDLVAVAGESFEEEGVAAVGVDERLGRSCRAALEGPDLAQGAEVVAREDDGDLARLEGGARVSVLVGGAHGRAQGGRPRSRVTRRSGPVP